MTGDCRVSKHIGGRRDLRRSDGPTCIGPPFSGCSSSRTKPSGIASAKYSSRPHRQTKHPVKGQRKKVNAGTSGRQQSMPKRLASLAQGIEIENLDYYKAPTS